jgi:hypothetical protein
MGATIDGKTATEVHDLETEEGKKERTKSLIIVYFTLFLQSLGLAIAMTGVWPFLDKVNQSSRITIQTSQHFRS